MKVNVRCFGSLAEKIGSTLTASLEERSTLRDLLLSLGVDPEGISVLVLNGRQVTAEVALREGDSVMLVPPVIGGCWSRGGETTEYKTAEYKRKRYDTAPFKGGMRFG